MPRLHHNQQQREEGETQTHAHTQTGSLVAFQSQGYSTAEYGILLMSDSRVKELPQLKTSNQNEMENTTVPHFLSLSSLCACESRSVCACTDLLSALVLGQTVSHTDTPQQAAGGVLTGEWQLWGKEKLMSFFCFHGL